MKHRDQLKDQLAAHLAAFTDTELPKLDFDALGCALRETITWLDSQSHSNSDLTTLRTDYEARIRGMLKAMAAVRTSPEALAAALAEIEALESLSVPHLLECYRKTAARFRDTFPASYGLLAGRGSGHARRDYADYK